MCFKAKTEFVLMTEGTRMLMHKNLLQFKTPTFILKPQTVL